MEIFKTVASLQNRVKKIKTEGKTLGFVPTMGALHEGHLTLLLEAKEEHDYSIASIFVNPTQFNDPDDLMKYPRPLEADIKALEGLGCDFLLLPSVEEVYPPGLTGPELNLNSLDSSMEGAQRPGHFAGVVQVVHRLLDIVLPDALYMGQKDFQQYTIIAHMIKELSIPVALRRVAIVREPNGLAMSSRNVLLSPEGRQLAPVLHNVLEDLKYKANDNDTADLYLLKQEAINALLQAGIPKVFYLEIVDGYQLHPVSSWSESDYIVACATIEIDGVRLLDNIILKEENNPIYLKEQAEQELLKKRYHL